MSPLQVTNSAVSATTSSYTSQCVHDFVPANADLVLVEFSVNDWEAASDAAAAWMNNSQRRVPNDTHSQKEALPESVSACCDWADKGCAMWRTHLFWGCCVCVSAARF